MTAWQRRGAALLCGLALAAGAAPLSFPWLVFLAVPALATLLGRAQNLREAVAVGWWCGAAYFAASLNWIVEPFFVAPERHGWMAPFAIVLVAIGMGLFWAIAFALAQRFGGRSRIVAMVCLWTVAEFVRAHIFTGFPWGQISYGWSETPIFQHLALLGPHGLTFATLLVASLPVLTRWDVGAVGAAVAVGLALFAGAQRTGPVEMTDLTIRLIQPNAPQAQKWQRDMIPVFWDRGIALTEAGPRVDAVVWPETSLPFLWGSAPRSQARIIGAARGAHLIVGHRRYVGDGLRNALLHIGPDGTERAQYDKHHLVPFGEYVPFADLAARFGIHGLAANDGMGFAAGPGPELVSVDGLPAYIPLICYEAIFPGLAQLNGTRPGWLLHITNDAWFGSFSGPYQHMVQARARAIEQGLPLARAANTGISAMIDPYGRVVASLPLNTHGALDVELPSPITAPAYTRFGEWGWLLVVCVLFSMLLVRRGSKNKLTG